MTESRFVIEQKLSESTLDAYVPFYLANGDFGGTFDPFGGTFYDEFRAGGGAKRDVRTLLLAGLRAMDWWSEQSMNPDVLCLNEPTRQAIQAGRKAGKGDCTAAVRGEPFGLILQPASERFLDTVTEHRQVLDMKSAEVHSRYKAVGRCFEIVQFVHALESLIAYRIQAGEAMTLTVTSPRGWEDSSEGRLFDCASNLWCPGAVCIWASRGQWRDKVLTLPPGETLLYVAWGHRKLGEPRAEARRVAQWAQSEGFSSLRASHNAWWSDRWGRFDLSIPDQDIETMWRRSVYYCFCSYPRRVRDGLCGTAGLTGSFPSFFSGYHPQDSVMQLFPAAPLGGVDLYEASLHWIESVLPVAREYARSFYWSKGARYIWDGGPGMLPFIPGHTRSGAPAHEHHVNGWIALAIGRYLQATNWPEEQVRRFEPVARELARFFAAMATPRGGGWEIRFAPVHSQAETVTDYENQPNLFDMLAAARYTMLLAGNLARRTHREDEETRHFDTIQAGLRFDLLIGPGGTYLHHEGCTFRELKCPVYAATGVGFPIAQTFDETVLRKTIDDCDRNVEPYKCAWNSPMLSIAHARLGNASSALRYLAEFLSPEAAFTDARLILLRECGPKHIPGGLAGRMPYFITTHGLFASAVCEMLLQDWTGKEQAFPACPWEEASFRMWANARCYRGTKKGEEISFVQL